MSEYEELRAFVQEKFGGQIDQRNEFRLAASLSNVLYANVELKQSDVDYTEASCVRAVIEGEVGMICQGFQITFLYLLKAFGLKCRPVVLFRHTGTFTKEEQDVLMKHWEEDLSRWTPFCMSGETPYEFAVRQIDEDQNHAVVEVHVDGKWRIFDPTFNCVYRCDGEVLSCDELSECIERGGVVEFEYTYQANKQRIEDYYLPLKYHNLIFNCDETSELFKNNVQMMAHNTGLSTAQKKELVPYDWKNNYVSSPIYRRFRDDGGEES